MTPRRRRLPPPLLALTPGTLAMGDERGARELSARVAAAAEEGLTGLLIREPQLFDLEVLELARRLREVLGPEAWIGVHDRLHLAVDPDLNGVQLGFQSLTPQAASTALERVPGEDPRPALGFSAHGDDAPGRRQGADFLLLAPVFRTDSHPDPTRPDYREPLGLDGLAAQLAAEPRPTWALGGIEPSNASDVLATGVRGLAVRGALLGRESPAAAAQATRDLIAAGSSAT